MGLGRLQVRGLNRVPNPPAIITAFMGFSTSGFSFLEFVGLKVNKTMILG
jgi:hypothetical protein